MQHNSEISRGAHLPRWIAGAVLTGLLLTGCGYGEVAPRTYEYATALYSICNRRDSARLEEFAKLLEADVEAGHVTDHEAGLLEEIAGEARTGEWDSAQAAARQLLEDQVRGR